MALVELSLRTLEQLFLLFYLPDPLLHLLFEVPKTGYLARLVRTLGQELFLLRSLRIIFFHFRRLFFDVLGRPR